MFGEFCAGSPGYRFRICCRYYTRTQLPRPDYDSGLLNVWRILRRFRGDGFRIRCQYYTRTQLPRPDYDSGLLNVWRISRRFLRGWLPDPLSVLHQDAATAARSWPRFAKCLENFALVPPGMASGSAAGVPLRSCYIWVYFLINSIYFQ